MVRCVILHATFNSQKHSAEVELPEGLKQIEMWAFFSFQSHVMQIVIPSTVKAIGVALFDGCNQLEDVKLLEGPEYICELSFGCWEQ